VNYHDLFTLLGRYFWLWCVGVSAYHYVSGIRSLASKDAADPRASAEAIALRRWIAVGSALPWLVMGWGIEVGGVPSVWYFFRPQEQALLKAKDWARHWEYRMEHDREWERPGCIFQLFKDSGKEN
jgi:hypothetical protein